MSTIKTQLTELVAHFETARAVGHTAAMLDGALKTPRCIILAGNQQSGEGIEDLAGLGADIMVIGVPGLREGRLRGLHRPLLIDNYAAHLLFSEALKEINRLEGKLADVRDVTEWHSIAVKNILAW